MNNKKFIAAATAITLATTVSAPISSANQLSDIDNDTYSYEITELVERGVISGYNDGTFKPNKQLTRSDVVKILGKYLVSLGYEIPKDYKTNLRFNDLSKQMNDELLKYAALVKDIGVFNGDRGRLLASNKLTNEQAANVLVRAFSKIDAFDYITFVEQQTFFKDFDDTSSMTGESKQSIDVIDYYDIVSRDSFLPKQAVTRGAFASMLYRTIDIQNAIAAVELSVRSIIAVTPTRLTVTLSDATTHNVYLDTPLQENVSTPVTFTIGGDEYSGRATYYTKQLEVVDVVNDNSGQFTVHFNQEVDLPTTYSADDLAKMFTLTRPNSGSSYLFLKGELSEDKKSFTVTLSSKTALDGTHRLKMEGIRALNGKSLADFDETVYFTRDTKKPYVKSVENITNTRVKVTFSEPVYSVSRPITFTRADGSNVYGISTTIDDRPYFADTNKTEIVFDLSGIYLSEGAAITAKILGLRDLAGNFLSDDYTVFSLRKGGQDQIPPKLTAIEQISAKQFKLTFNEAMSSIQTYQLSLTGNRGRYTIEKVEQLSDDPASFIVTVDNYLDGRLTLSTDENYPVQDATGTSSKLNKVHVFDYDTTAAKIINTETIREDNILYAYIYFDRNVIVDEGATVKLHGSYLYQDKNVEIGNPQPATVYATDDKRVVKVPVKELLRNYDRLHSLVQGELSFTNVLNEYRTPVESGPIEFERTADTVFNTEVLQLLSVETSRTSKDIQDSNQLILNFNYPLDPQGVDDLFNYELTGYKLKSAVLNKANPRQVILTIDSHIPKPDEPFLYVYNLKTESAMLDMETYYERVYLNENVAPQYVTHEVSNANQIKLTFNEALNPVDERSFYVEDMYGNGQVAKASLDPTNSSRIILTLDKRIYSGTYVTIRQMPGRIITDYFYNVGTFKEITVYTGNIK